MSLVNSQITASVGANLQTTIGAGPAVSNDMVYLALASSLSNLMQNSTVTQFNGQTVAVAALSQTCALIISAAVGGSK